MSNDNNIKALKSGFWYAISNALVKSIGLITTPLFTRLLTKAEFGEYSNYSSWTTIISIFITLNLHSTLISARYDYKDDFDEYIFSMLGLSTLVSFFGLILTTFIPSEISAFLKIDIKYVYSIQLYLLFLPAVTLFQTRERYYYEYKKTVISSVILSVSTAFLSVLLVVILPDRLEGMIVGSVIPTIVMGMFFYLYFAKRGKHIRVSYWKYALPICLPYIPHLLSMTLLNSMDRVMIKRICGPEQTALYSLAYNCGALVTIFLTSMNNAFTPWLAENLKEEKYERIKIFSYKYVVLFSLLVVAIMLISPEALLILGGRGYLEAVYVLAPVSMGCTCQFLYTMFVNVEQFYKKTIGMAFASITAAVVNFLLNYYFIPRIGYLAAAYTTLVGYLVLLAIHMYLVHRMKKSYIYDYRFIVMIVVAGIVVMIGITTLYSYSIIRYLIISVYVIATLIVSLYNKQKIIQILKTIF